MDTKIRNMLEVLESIEDCDGEDYCRICEGAVGYHEGGYKHHEPDCELAAILYPEETKDVIADAHARIEWNKERYKVVTITGHKFSAEEHLHRNREASTFLTYVPFLSDVGLVEAGVLTKDRIKINAPPFFRTAYTKPIMVGDCALDAIIVAAMQAAWDILEWGYIKDTKGPYQKENNV